MAINLEVVSFQPDKNFFEGVTFAMHALRKSKDYTPTTDQVIALTKVIRDNTGINVKLTFENRPDPNAWVMIPTLDSNHPFSQKYWGSSFNHHDAHMLMQIERKKKLSGTVDLKKGRIGGDFSKLEVTMCITTGLLKNTGYKDEEIAAVLLHECGHVMTYFEYLTSTVRANIILQAVAEQVVKEPNEQRRIELLDATSKHFNWEMEDPADLAKATRSETVYTVLLTKHLQQRRSELGADVYDLRTFESVSDQYVTRMGGGRALATAMNKLYHNQMSKMSTGTYLFFEALKIIMATTILIFAPVTLILLMVMYDPTYRIYDRPGERIQRIYRQLIEASKDKSLTRDQKQTLTADIELVEGILKEYNDRRSFYEFLYTTFLPNSRKQHKKIQYQQELEQLASNPLFARAMTLSTLKS